MKLRRISAFVVAAAVASVLSAGDLPTFVENQKITSGFVNEMLGQRLVCDGLKSGASVDSGSTRWIYRDSGSWLSSAISTARYPSIAGDLVASVHSDTSLIIQGWPDGESHPTGTDPVYLSVSDADIVSLSGDRLAVSRPSASTIEMFRWILFVGWGQTHTYSGGSTYGDAIALDDDTLVIGEPGIGNGSTPGRLEIYDGFDSGPPTYQELVSPYTAAGDTFGASVSISGDWLAVGAPYDDGPGGSMVDVGVVFLYRRIGDSFQYWSTHYGQAAGERFGTDVHLAGDRMVAGAPFAAVGSDNQAGVATYFRVQNDMWFAVARLVASHPSPGAQLGTTVALSDLGAMAGAPYAAGYSGASNAGAVYTFDELAAFIFKDGFESGDTDAWSNATP